MSANDTAPPPPPETPTLSVTDAMVQHITRQALGHLSKATAAEQVPGIVAGAVRAAIMGERGRVVARIRQEAEAADVQAKRTGRAGRGQLSARYMAAASAAAGLAALIEAEGGESVCPTCRGARRVRSQVVLAGGEAVPVPCPACTTPPEGERH